MSSFFEGDSTARSGYDRDDHSLFNEVEDLGSPTTITRDPKLQSLIERWKSGEAQTGNMLDTEIEELDKAVELGLVSQEELMEKSDAA